MSDTYRSTETVENVHVVEVHRVEPDLFAYRATRTSKVTSFAGDIGVAPPVAIVREALVDEANEDKKGMAQMYLDRFGE